jgi:hypothetical protein
MTTNDKFWAVWKQNGGSTPNKRHETKESAIAEAGRLSRQEGAPYYVLEVIGIVAPVVAPVAYTEI